jgi:Zn-finger nucleic acid-binding protein
VGEILHCAVCGRELPEGAKFCLECGTAVPAQAGGTLVASTPSISPRSHPVNTTYCPDCGLKINVVEKNLGKKVICPKCQTILDPPRVPGQEGRTTYCPNCRLKLHVAEANLTKRAVCPKCQTKLDPPLFDPSVPSQPPQPPISAKQGGAMRNQSAQPKRRITGRQKAITLAVLLGAVLAFVIYSQATYHPDASASDTAWKQVSAQIYLDSQQYLNAQKVGNTGDMAAAAASLQKDCHNAEPLQHRGDAPTSSMEQQVAQVCAGFGFPLAPRP